MFTMALENQHSSSEILECDDIKHKNVYSTSYMSERERLNLVLGIMESLSLNSICLVEKKM